MALKIIFWLVVAFDVAAVGLFYLLGLAAAKPSHTSPLTVTLFMLGIPGLLLAGAIALFVFSKSPVGRVLAFLLVASPVLVAVGSSMYAQWTFRQNYDESGNLSAFGSDEAMREAERAIWANDAPRLETALRKVKVNERGRGNMTLLIVALRQMRKTPEQLEVLRTVMKAGADPNLAGTSMSGGELPLEVAIQMSGRAGVEPVKLLLDAGANPNARTQFGDPVFFQGGGKTVPIEVLQMLLDRGADVKLKGRDGKSDAILYATLPRNWKAVKLLIERGADWRQARRQDGTDFRTMVNEPAPWIKGTEEGLDEVKQLIAAK